MKYTNEGVPVEGMSGRWSPWETPPIPLNPGVSRPKN